MLTAFVTLVGLAAAAPPAPWRYELVVEPEALEVRARFPAGSGRGLRIGHPELVVGLDARTDCRAGCAVRYRVPLERAREADEIERRGALWTTRLGGWLARPRSTPAGAQFELRVRAADGLSYADGLPRQGAVRTGDAENVPHLPFVAFGELWMQTLRVEGAPLHVAAPRRGLPTSNLRAWIERNAASVAKYLGGFPAPDTLVILLPSGRGGVPFGSAHGYGATVVRIYVGRSASRADLDEDWKLRHELCHLALPNLHSRHRWMEEGLATYLETLLEAKQGRTSERALWRQLTDGFAQGAPRGDPFDGTRRWGETYWGGALFWFLVDLELRKVTEGREGLSDALARVVRAGGTMREQWPVRRLVRTMDEGLPKPVVEPMYRSWGRRGTRVDLDALWSGLGVGRGPRVELDARAPQARLRALIVRRW